MADIKWETYEEVAVYLLNEFANEFGLDTVETKQKVRGKKSGTNWVIDGKGFKKDGVGFVIVECRRYTTSKQNQEKIWIRSTFGKKSLINIQVLQVRTLPKVTLII